MKALKKINGVAAAVLLATVMMITLPTAVADELDTAVRIEPASQTVDAGETFTVNVTCVPGQPMKAYEFKVSFDASLLVANSVTEGNIFTGFMTYFNAGTINNVAGSIVNIYGLIVGTGNVSNPGTFVTISFTAKSKAGVSPLHFYSVGVCDENGYLTTNVTDGAVTVDGTTTPPSGPPGSPPENGGEENHPPESSFESSGPTFVEMGIEYSYAISTTDPDGDNISYMVDWGDGTTSDWSELVASGTSVFFTHSWMNVSTYQVQAIAQDEHGLNSSWEPVFNVTVAGVGEGGELPVANITVPTNVTVNQTIVFDASGSFDEGGVIVSYLWDFGDGTTGSGMKPVHVYTQPGEYQVVLVITDNAGNTYTKQITVTVAANTATSGSEPQQSALPMNLLLMLLGSVFAVLVGLAVVFRHRIQLFLLDRQINSLSSNGITTKRHHGKFKHKSQ